MISNLFFRNGAQGRNRTTDTVIFSHAHRNLDNLNIAPHFYNNTKNINHIKHFTMTRADTERTLPDNQVN
jgi:hypothetical protein